MLDKKTGMLIICGPVSARCPLVDTGGVSGPCLLGHMQSLFTLQLCLRTGFKHRLFLCALE